MTKNIFIIRHCKAEGQSSEAPLTEKGFIQTKVLTAFFRNKKIDCIISSPFLRAVQTIEPIAKQKGLPIKKDSRLSERVLSAVQLSDWMDKLEATYIDPALAYEGGESSDEAKNRIAAVVEEAKTSKFENIIIVTHGNIMSLLLGQYDKRFGFKEWKNLSNPDVFLLQPSEKGNYVERIWEKEQK